MLRRMLPRCFLSWHWSWFPLVRFQPRNALDLPPGIAAQAQPLPAAAMMTHMQQMGLSLEQMEMMMADMQMMADQLPPGIFR